jgi:hypothetical protein
LPIFKYIAILNRRIPVKSDRIDDVIFNFKDSGSGKLPMNKLEKGTWIVNSIKHLLKVRTNTPELAYYEATEVAGKAGLLLSRFVADEQEIISEAKTKVFARESGITRVEILACLNCLKEQEKIDFNVDSNGNRRIFKWQKIQPMRN